MRARMAASYSSSLSSPRTGGSRRLAVKGFDVREAVAEEEDIDDDALMLLLLRADGYTYGEEEKDDDGGGGGGSNCVKTDGGLPLSHLTSTNGSSLILFDAAALITEFWWGRKRER